METTTGFNVELEEGRMDDWQVVKCLRKIDSGEIQYVVDLLPLLLGEEGTKALENHLQKVEGTIKFSSMVREVSEILQAQNKTKN